MANILKAVALAAVVVCVKTEEVDITVHNELQNLFDGVSMVESEACASAGSCLTQGAIACDAVWKKSGEYVLFTTDGTTQYYWHAGSDNKMKRTAFTRMSDLTTKYHEIWRHINTGNYRFIQKDTGKKWTITRQVFSGRHRIEMKTAAEYNAELNSDFFELIISQNGAYDQFQTQVVSIGATMRPYGEAWQTLLKVVLSPESNHYVEAANRDPNVTEKLDANKSIRFMRQVRMATDYNGYFALALENKLYGGLLSTTGNQDGRLHCNAAKINSASIWNVIHLASTTTTATFKLTNQAYSGTDKQITADVIPEPENDFSVCLAGPGRGQVPTFTLRSAGDPNSHWILGMNNNLKDAFCEENTHTVETLMWTGGEGTMDRSLFRWWALATDVERREIFVNKHLFPSWR